MAVKKRILLTGIGGNTAQGVAKSLLKFPREFTIIGSDSDKYNAMFGYRYAKRVYLVPNAKAENYIDTLSKIVKREKIDLLIPSPDQEVYEISKHRKELGTKIFLPKHRVIEISQDKWLTYKTLKGKVQQPVSFLIMDPKALSASISKLQIPFWLRMRKGTGGSRSFIAHNLDQARFWVEYWNGYGKFIASQILKGRNLSWIGLYKNGKLITSGGYHRLRYLLEHVSPTGVTGTISAGLTIHDEKTNDVAEKAIRVLDGKPNGVYVVDLKDNDKGPNVTEVNAGRLHMSFYVYTEAGINLPYYYVKLALNELIKLPTRKNAHKAGILTIRNIDNEPLFIDSDKLDDGILIP